MRKFFGWLAGIVASAIVVWFGWYLNKPPAPASTTTFEGMVINGAAEAPLQDAIVSVEIPGAANSGPFHDPTDQNGAYRLDFTGLGKLTGATIAVEAKGFQTVAPASLATVGSDNRQDFTLMPEVVVSPPHSGGGSVGGAHPPIVPRIVPYVQKPVDKAFRFSLQPKP
jgi:hypothetical protein